MNLLMVCVLLLVALVCQPTLIYGLKGSHNSAAAATANGDHDLHQRQRSVKTFGGKVKRSRSNTLHSATAAELANTKLVMALESGDILVRRATRGANAEGVDDSATNIDAANTGVGAGAGAAGGKRNKNGNANKNGGRGKQDKKYSATIGSQTQQQQQQQQQQHHGHHGSGNGNGNGNGKGRQRQQHQGHGKRGGNGANSRARPELAEKFSTADKALNSCRYAKSAWSECDPKTNMRSRTLTLKKGEANCLATRTMQKKCKKTCRYEKGAWSECINGQMTRQDKLKSNAPSGTTEASAADSGCAPVRDINKKCNPGGTKNPNKGNKERKQKDKVQRRAQQA